MSLLEELRRKAHQTRNSESNQRRALDARRARAYEQLRPKLTTLYRYFKELAEHLNVIDEPVLRTFHHEGLGAIRDLRQSGYHCASPAPDVHDRFTFQFRCAAPGRVEERIAHPSRARAEAELLRRHGLRFRSEPLPSGGCAFSVEKRVPVALEFSMDLDREAVRLRTKNLGELGVATMNLAPRSIDQALIEELAKRILAQPDQFHRLTGYSIEPDRRAALQRKMRREQRRRAAELKGPAARALWALGDWVARRLGRE